MNQVKSNNNQSFSLKTGHFFGTECFPILDFFQCFAVKVIPLFSRFFCFCKYSLLINVLIETRFCLNSKCLFLPLFFISFSSSRATIVTNLDLSSEEGNYFFELLITSCLSASYLPSVQTLTQSH